MCLVGQGIALQGRTPTMSLKNSFLKQVPRTPMARSVHPRESCYASCISLTTLRFGFSCPCTNAISVTS